MIDSVIRCCVVPGSNMTDREAVTLILAILETGTDNWPPAKAKLRVIDADQK